MAGRADERQGLSLLDRAAEATGRVALQAGVGFAVVEAAAIAADLPGRTGRALKLQDNLMFPLDLITNINKHYMSLRFVKYSKRSIYDRKTIESQGTIALPIPNQLNDTTTLSYSNEPIGSMLGAFVEASSASSDQLTTRAAGIAASLRQVITGLPGGEQILDAGSAVAGLAFNPFLTVVFKGPQFKTHNFSWKFFPRSKQESDELTKIVKTIKYHILPGLLNTSGVIFEYPEMVLLNIFPSEDNLYNFKPCIVKSLNVNYAPSGGPSFFRNSLAAPTGIELKIEFQEIEYFTKIDIDPTAMPTPSITETQVPFMSSISG